jgi:hypothetical protein
LRGFRTQADPRIGGSGFSQLGTLPTLRVARCTLQSPRDQRCMQDGIVTNPIGSLSSGAPAGIAGAVVEQATHLLRKASSVAGAPDLRRVADDVIDIAEAEPGRAADLLEAMKPQLSLTARRQPGSRHGTTGAVDRWHLRPHADLRRHRRRDLAVARRLRRRRHQRGEHDPLRR